MFDEAASRLLTTVLFGQYEPYETPLRPWWVNLLILGFVGVVVWLIVRSRFDFKIVVKPDEVHCRGAISLAQQRKIRTFFEDSAPVTGKVTVLGRRAKNGRLALTFRGLPDRGRQQQVRNFLLTLL